ICFRLLAHWVRAAASRTFCTAGKSRPMSTAMMAITTSNSMRVNALRWEVAGEDLPLRIAQVLRGAWLNSPRLGPTCGCPARTRHIDPDSPSGTDKSLVDRDGDLGNRRKER